LVACVGLFPLRRDGYDDAYKYYYNAQAGKQGCHRLSHFASYTTLQIRM